MWFARNAVLGAITAPYALITLGLTPFQFGCAAALMGLGGLLGATTSSAGGRLLRTGGAIIVADAAAALTAVVLLVAGLGPGGWTAAAVLGLGQFCFGFGIGFGNSHEMAFRQALTPDRLQARTNTTMRSLNRAVVVVVAPLGGLLADQAGIRVALVTAGSIFVLAVLLLVVTGFARASAEES